MSDQLPSNLPAGQSTTVPSQAVTALPTAEQLAAARSDMDALVARLKAAPANNPVDNESLRLARKLVGSANGQDVLILQSVAPELFVSTADPATGRTRHQFDRELKKVDAKYPDEVVSHDEVCAGVIALAARRAIGQNLPVRDAATHEGLSNDFLAEATRLMDKVCGCAR